MKRIACLLGVVLVALSSAAPALAESYVISRGVWGYYQQYLKDIGSTRDGAFAITMDGGGAYYVYCPGRQCMPGTTFRHKAITRCESEYKTKCIAFADRDDILVAYTLAEATPDSGSAPQLAPAPVTRVSLSSEAKATVERYLKNSQTAGKAWALAITKDGSKAYSADCPTFKGGHYGDGGAGASCNLNSGTAQELAERKAMQSCGGPASCVLLYRGTQKVANIEIAAN